MATINNSSNHVITQYNVATGGASNTLNSVTPSTAGFVLTSNGASAQPTFQAASSGVTATDYRYVFLFGGM